jgi:predicted ATPase
MRGYSSLSEKMEPDARNIAGVIAALPKEKQQEIEGVLTRYASQLPERDIRRVYAETVGKFKTDAMLYCEEHWRDDIEPPTVDARGMSDGTLRFLAILTALLTRPKSSLLVVEEVDNGLHPSRARLLLEVLQNVGKQRGVDVLVTTHNPALLDAMGSKMVPFITVAHRDPVSGVSVLTLMEDIVQLPKLLAQGQIGRLSSEGLIEKTLARQLEFNFDKSRVNE